MALAGVHMAPRARRTFSAGFKAETVELIRSSGKTIGQVCCDLNLTDTAVRRLACRSSTASELVAWRLGAWDPSILRRGPPGALARQEP
jgi:hypothetical protein